MRDRDKIPNSYSQHRPNNLTTPKWMAGAESLQGLRPNNEDRFLIDPGLSLFVVADGMGGHDAGEEASLLAIQAIHKLLKSDGSNRTGQAILAEALDQANLAILEAAQSMGHRKMGTTIVLLAKVAGSWWIANLGDSEAWLFRKGRRTILSQAHNMAAELVRQKAMAPKEAALSPLKHRLVRYLGSMELKGAQSVFSDIRPFQPKAGDALLLGTDGLMDHVSEAKIRDGLGKGLDPQSLVQELTREALNHGSPDNATGLLVQFF